MTAQRITRTYEGRVPAQPMVEDGVLWVPVAHHIDGVFENRDTFTTVTFAQAEGALAEETLALIDEYRTLSRRVESKPHPGEHFELHPTQALPSWLGEPVERAGWQVYTPGETLYASHVAQGTQQVTWYRLSPKVAGTTSRNALEQFERAIVEHGRTHIKLKQIIAQMNANANTLKQQLQDA